MISYHPSNTDRARWQRRSANVLAAMLRTYPHLPVIAWKIPPGGTTLIGHVYGLAPAATVRHTFNTWRTTLSLTERSPITTTHETVHHLRATADHDHVRISLTATAFDDWDEDQPQTPS